MPRVAKCFLILFLNSILLFSQRDKHLDSLIVSYTKATSDTDRINKYANIGLYIASKGNYAEAITYHQKIVQTFSKQYPEKCIDAVGMEAHATASLDAMYDKVKQSVMLETDRPHVLREMMYVCRPAGTLSVPGVYGGVLDKIPFGAVMNKGLTIRTGQTHVNRWTDDLLHRIEEGQIDPSFVVTHRVRLEDGPDMYKTFRDKKDGCIKVVLKPN